MSQRSRRKKGSSSTRGRSNKRTLKVTPVGKLKRKKTWLFYGRPGSGKSVLFSTFPGKKLLLDVGDEGTDSIANVKDINVADLSSWNELEEAYWYLHENPDEYDVVCIDTITALQQLLIQEITESKDLKGKRAGDWGTMTKSDWGTVASKMKVWLTNFRNLPMEVVFLAQDRVFGSEEENFDEDEEVYLGPCVSPSIKTHIGAEVTVIGYLFVRQREKKIKSRGKDKTRMVTEYCLRLGPHQDYMIKVRKPRDVKIPEILVDPNYEEIIEIIQGE